MNYKKIVLAIMLVSTVSVQAGWFSDAKNWVKKQVEKVTISSKKIKNEIVQEVEDIYQSEVQSPDDDSTQQETSSVQVQKGSKQPSRVLHPEQVSLADALGRNVGLLSELTQLNDRVFHMVETNPNFDALSAIYIDQMLDGFKQTSGVSFGEVEVVKTMINNITTSLNDFEAGYITSQKFTDFITETFDWWKQTYWTEAMISESVNDYLSDDDWQKEEEYWFSDEDVVSSGLSYFEKNASPKEKEAAIAVVGGGLLEQMRAGKKLKSIHSNPE